MSDSREFLFKAVRKDNGEWVEGDLIGNSVPGKTFIQRDYGDTVEHFEVYFHTVCQFWRMLKDGVRLFSGDVLVTGHSGSLGPNLDTWEEDDFSRTCVIIEKGDFTCSNWDVDWDSDDSIYEPQFCRVVGNIHDTGKEKDVPGAKFVDVLLRLMATIFPGGITLDEMRGQKLRDELLAIFKTEEEKK